MSGCFEANHWDGIARTGKLTVPSGDVVRTPALLPVVDPRRRTIEPRELRELGAEALITNAYIIHGEEHLRAAAREQGLHELLDFDGVIMTDSGSFQLAEYGDIDVTSAEILEFQLAIGSDIVTPVDVPTGPDASRSTAEADIETTTERLRAAAAMDRGEALLNGPVQGATFPDLREAAASAAADIDVDIHPIGGVVPLLNAYRFAAAIEATLAAKRGLGPAAPVHLFGVGHPMLFALAAAAGCDLFDSAAYAVYARDGRYLTPRGTRHLDDMETFPCECPVCTQWTPGDMLATPDEARTETLARHNLHVSFGELRRVRHAIRAGDLFELLETRARAHPRVLDGYRELLGASEDLEARDPTRKSAFFYVGPESAERPEVRRHRRRLDRLADHLADPALLIEPRTDPGADPAEPTSRTGGWTPGEPRDGGPVTEMDRPEVVVEEARGITSDPFADIWFVRPPFGPFPPALARTYPLTAELPRTLDRGAYREAARSVTALDRATDATLTLAHRGWPADALTALPETVEREDIGAGGKR